MTRLLRVLVLAIAMLGLTVFGALLPAHGAIPIGAYDYSYDGTSAAECDIAEAHRSLCSEQGGYDGRDPRGSLAWRYDDHANLASASARPIAYAPVPRAAAVNGETAATRYGRLMHKTYDYGPGFQREFTLPSGRRVDGINFGTRQIIELKPNNPRAIRNGNKQLDDYIDELNDQFPGSPWTGKVETYDRP